MDGQRIIAHIIMWSLIIVGIVLAFGFLPAIQVFPLAYQSYLVIISIPISIICLYYLASAIYFRAKFPLISAGFGKIIKAGVYGRVVHPTCMALAIAGWVLFVFFPDWRTLASDLWMTLVVFFWIKVEENAYAEKPEEKEGADTIG